jgi:2,3-bisphosphoglycerate-independent phosphoglycerate mutase
MVDYSAGEISTAEARELINYLKGHLDSEDYTLYSGVSYRHCLVLKNGRIAGDVVPPHDITGRKIFNYLPKSIEGRKRLSLMEKSYELLKDHPINQKRVKEGKNPANSLWLWGEGTKPNLQNFEERFGLKGAMISAVDLLKGIGKLVGMQVIEVEGATGNYDTNFSGKAEACVNALKNGIDFVYVHMEAPDECGHHGDLEKKIYSIEQIDEKVVKYVVESLEDMGEDFAILIAPDHPTPVSTMTHCSDPVPFLIYNSKNKNGEKEQGYDEEQAEKTGLFVRDGYELIKMLIKD